MYHCIPGCGIRLACAGYAVIGMDYEGHGKSKGARCYIKKFENIVNDCYNFFKSVSGRSTNLSLLAGQEFLHNDLGWFLMGFRAG